MHEVVPDGRPGVRQLFTDIPATFTRSRSSRLSHEQPKLEAGIELKEIVAGLCEAKETDFTPALNVCDPCS
jgi:hypothetical protein